MASLTLDPEQVASERQVILEEIAMYDSEPWDALEMAVHERLFAGHPYGRPVLGTREELLATGAEELRAFHRRFYRPDNAVLVVAGDVGDEALDAIERTLGGTPAGSGAAPRLHAARRAASSAWSAWSAARGGGAPAPRPAGAAGAHPDHPALRLAATLLGGRAHQPPAAHAGGGGAALRLGRRPTSPRGLDASMMTIAAEVVPGVEPARVEARVLELLADLLRNPPGEEELERCRQIAAADWVFGHEKVHQQALSAGLAMALFDLEYLDRHLEQILATGPDRLLEVADRYLHPERGGVAGWSLPKS